MSELVSALVGLLAGYGFRVVVEVRQDKSVTKTTQEENIVGGDQAGRDINK